MSSAAIGTFAEGCSLTAGLSVISLMNALVSVHLKEGEGKALWESSLTMIVSLRKGRIDNSMCTITSFT